MPGCRYQDLKSKIMTANQDIYDNVIRAKINAKKGDELSLISVRGDVLIVDKGGNRFSVHKSKVDGYVDRTDN